MSQENLREAIAALHVLVKHADSLLASERESFDFNKYKKTWNYLRELGLVDNNEYSATYAGVQFLALITSIYDNENYTAYTNSYIPEIDFKAYDPETVSINACVTDVDRYDNIDQPNLLCARVQMDLFKDIIAACDLASEGNTYTPIISVLGEYLSVMSHVADESNKISQIKDIPRRSKAVIKRASRTGVHIEDPMYTLNLIIATIRERPNYTWQEISDMFTTVLPQYSWIKPWRFSAHPSMNNPVFRHVVRIRQAHADYLKEYLICPDTYKHNLECNGFCLAADGDYAADSKAKSALQRLGLTMSHVTCASKLVKTYEVFKEQKGIKKPRTHIIRKVKSASVTNARKRSRL